MLKGSNNYLDIVTNVTDNVGLSSHLSLFTASPRRKSAFPNFCPSICLFLCLLTRLSLSMSRFSSFRSCSPVSVVNVGQLRDNPIAALPPAAAVPGKQGGWKAENVVSKIGPLPTESHPLRELLENH